MGNLYLSCEIISNKNTTFKVSIVPKNSYEEKLEILISENIDNCSCNCLDNCYSKIFTKSSLSKELKDIFNPTEFLNKCIEKRSIELIETNDNSSIKLILINNLNKKKYQLIIPQKNNSIDEIIFNLSKLEIENSSFQKSLNDLKNEIDKMKSRIFSLEEKLNDKKENNFFDKIISSISKKKDEINDFHFHDFSFKYSPSKYCSLCSNYYEMCYSCEYCKINFCEFCKKKFDNYQNINKIIHPGHKMILFKNALKEECICCRDNSSPRFYCTFCKFGLCVNCFFGYDNQAFRI